MAARIRCTFHELRTAPYGGFELINHYCTLKNKYIKADSCVGCLNNKVKPENGGE